MGESKSYLKRWMLMLGWLMCAVVIQGDYVGKCPEECSCLSFEHLSDGPSLRVKCKSGGRKRIPVDDLNRNISQLIIAPSPNDPNFLTIGSVLTQPKPFSNLRDIIIVNSNVPSIGIHSFWGLRKLKTLNLTGNGITSITTENFRGLLNLTTLALDYNNINQMESGTFLYMESLKRLSLSHNNITVLVPRVFRSLGKLEKLDLSYNPIKDLDPQAFGDIQNLLNFKCRQCMLGRLNALIYHLAPLIEELDFGENFFKFLAEDDFINLRKLMRLHLDGNQVSVIVNDVFKENKELDYIDIGNNKIALLAPKALNNLKKLTHLKLENNKISKFDPETFGPVRKCLRSLDLSGNDLSVTEIFAVLKILTKIEDVKLANLSISDVPDDLFINNLQLLSLDISRNQITRFPIEALRRNKELKTLDISHNKIKSMKNMELDRLVTIPTIHLSHNEWRCNRCSIKNMLSYMKTSVLNESLRHLQCQEPLKLRGRQFEELTDEILEDCEPDPTVIKVTVVFLIIGTVAMAEVARMCYKCLRNTRENTNKDHENQRGRPEERSQDDSVATIHSPHHPTLNCS